MSDETLWRSVRDLAAAWQDTDTVQRFAQQLPRNADQRSTGLPGTLQHAHAAAGSLMAHPMRYATALRIASSVVPQIDPVSLRAEHGEWFDAAERVEAANRLTIAWLRARLPSYPRLPAPQLAPGTPLTTDEFSHRLVWTHAERAQGLQLQDAPRGVADVLQTKGGKRDLAQAARSVAAALRATAEWAHLHSATAALDEPSRQNLREARRRIRERLSPRSVDNHEPDLAMRRADYRDAVTAAEIGALTGPADEYARTFGAANNLIETVASDVFGQLTCYGVDTVTPEDVDTTPDEPPRISFTLTDPDIWPEVGILVWLDDPLLKDAVRVSSIQVQFQAVETLTVRVDSEVLPQSSLAWR